jgi:uncharacterized membrane protein HdeD (DUF308 family)
MKALSRVWGWIALRGVVAILFGILTLLYPKFTLTALVLLFGAYALVDGVLMIVWAVSRRRAGGPSVALLAGGLLGIAAGILTFFIPGITAVALLIVIAVWAIATGVSMIVTALRLRKLVGNEWELIVAGLLAVALGVILIAAPAAGALAMVLWIGSYALVSGILLVVIGFRLRSWLRTARAVLQ